MTNNIQARWHFAIPIYEIILDEFAVQQQSVIDTVLAMRKQDEGIKRSNIGGWHSDDQLHVQQDKTIQWLMHSILRVASVSIHDFEKDRPHGEPVMTSSWVNVNDAHNWNLPHQHLPADWSGVFYVSTEEDPERQAGAPCPGDILFYDPLPLGARHKRQCTINYAPRNGLLLLFPSYLMHMVMPHNSDNLRISISFNIRVPLTPAEIQAAETLQKNKSK